MTEENRTILLMGSNLGDSKAMMGKARALLEKNIGEIMCLSSLYKTAAWGNKDQPAFINQAVLLVTGLGPLEIMHKILAIEEQLGRVREKKWDARIIDIDILSYNEEIIEEEGLIIPHPLLHNRRFSMIPMLEIAGNWQHPILKKSLRELLKDSEDACEVERL
ncbi:MAG: 2-amino-4-hydroxy-6-hydroxymethyldihydropteridine diphosphokinase [Bacteroidota bacterium]|nr:2-amino-4-hydroxy-6-hydroxymethyldihydropteridine diphosphokinase [Bacteroidota bacterium]